MRLVRSKPQMVHPTIDYHWVGTPAVWLGELDSSPPARVSNRPEVTVPVRFCPQQRSVIGCRMSIAVRVCPSPRGGTDASLTTSTSADTPYWRFSRACWASWDVVEP